MKFIEINSSNKNYNKIFTYTKSLYYDTKLRDISINVINKWSQNNVDKINKFVLNNLLDNENPVVQFGNPYFGELLSDKIVNIKNGINLQENLNLGKFVVTNDNENNRVVEVNRFKVAANRLSLGVNNNKSVEVLNCDYLVNSPNQNKINVVKNLYNFFREEIKYDNYKNLNWGFRNFNCLKFFTVGKDQLTDESEILTHKLETHKNVIVYPNLLVNEKNLYQVNLNNFTFTSYLNINDKRDLEVKYNPGCLIYIPNKISIHILDNLNEDRESFRVLVAIEEYSSLSLDSLISSVDLSNSNKSSSQDNKVFLSEDGFLKFNHWEFLTVRTSKNYVEIFQQRESNIFEKLESDSTLDIDSFISIGNRVLFNNLENGIKTFFSCNSTSDLEFNGPYVTKSIKTATDRLITGIPVEEFVIKNKLYLKEGFSYENYSLMSEAFHGEIHDIKFYNNVVSNENIKKYSLSNKKLDDDLIFYVPVYYVPLKVNKTSLLNYKGNFNNNDFDYNIRYTSVINNSLYNFSGIVDVSTESFLYEFVKGTTPNLVFGGSNVKDSELDQILKSNNISEAVFENIYKKGLSFIDNISNSIVDSKDFSLWKSLCSFIEKNSFIVPCDNGLQKQNYSVIEESEFSQDLTFIDDLGVYDRTFVSLNNIYLHDGFDYSAKTLDRLGIDNNKINIISRNRYEQSFFTTEDLNNSTALYTFLTQQGLVPMSPYFPVQSFKTNSNVCTRICNEPIDARSFIGNNSDIKQVSPDLSVNYFSTYNSFQQINKIKHSPTSKIISMKKFLYDIMLKDEDINIIDKSIARSGGCYSMSIKDAEGCLYRADCLTPHAKWNYIGHVFYDEGMFTLHHPSLYYFGNDDLEIRYTSKSKLYVNEVNIDLEKGELNKSYNSSYINDLRLDDSSFNADEDFVYITDINIHDQYFNIVAKAKLAQPFAKKDTDSARIRLKLDY